MNALYCDASGVILDPLNGLEDLQARRIRFIGDAEDRIREDYLRILRFFRFFRLVRDGAAGRRWPESLRAAEGRHCDAFS
jgi:hypothetical protein